MLDGVGQRLKRGGVTQGDVFLPVLDLFEEPRPFGGILGGEGAPDPVKVDVLAALKLKAEALIQVQPTLDGAVDLIHLATDRGRSITVPGRAIIGWLHGPETPRRRPRLLTR
jgi:hypothetical protein